MRNIINYLKQCFCKHEFELVNDIHVYSEKNNYKMPVGYKQIYFCKKCGYVKKINI